MTPWQHLQQSVEAADAVSELLLLLLRQRGAWRLHAAHLQLLLRLWRTLMALRFGLGLVACRDSFFLVATTEPRFQTDDALTSAKLFEKEALLADDVLMLK